jgi:hypothetical protein
VIDIHVLLILGVIVEICIAYCSNPFINHHPTGTYTVCSLDGSSTVGECARRVCAEANVRAPPYSGYALYADDPAQPQPSATASTAGSDSTAILIVLRTKDKVRVNIILIKARF